MRSARNFLRREPSGCCSEKRSDIRVGRSGNRVVEAEPHGLIRLRIRNKLAVDPLHLIDVEPVYAVLGVNRQSLEKPSEPTPVSRLLRDLPKRARLERLSRLQPSGGERPIVPKRAVYENHLDARRRALPDKTSGSLNHSHADDGMPPDLAAANRLGAWVAPAGGSCHASRRSRGSSSPSRREGAFEWSRRSRGRVPTHERRTAISSPAPNAYGWAVTYARAGGFAAIGVSAVLLVVVLVRDVGLNVLNGWTIFLGLAAGVVVLLQPRRPVVVAAIVAVALAMFPALIGGLGLLFLPSLFLLVMSLPRIPDAAPAPYE